MDRRFTLNEGMWTVISWIKSWWITWRIWRESDAEQWAALTGPFDPEDFVEVDRP